MTHDLAIPMLIVENSEQMIHVTIPALKKRKAFVFEQHTPSPETENTE